VSETLRYLKLLNFETRIRKKKAPQINIIFSLTRASIIVDGFCESADDVCESFTKNCVR
jgi:hypothetical protein